jgi:hypothetical protein
MRKALCVLLIVSFFHFVMPEWSAAADLPECRLMTNPVNPEGKIDEDRECILALQEEIVVTMSNGSGSWGSPCRLQPGVAVVVDAETGDWLRVMACSNEFPKEFSPLVAGTLNCMPRDTAETQVRIAFIFSPILELSQPIPTPPQIPQIKIKKKKKAWPWGVGIVVGLLIGGVVVKVSGGSKSSPGGPSSDPKH